MPDTYYVQKCLKDPGKERKKTNKNKKTIF